MRVLYVLSRDDQFGAPRALMEMVTTLKKNYDIDPVILTPCKNKINDQCNELGIENYHMLYGTAMKREKEYLLNIIRRLLYCYGNIITLKRIKKKIGNIDLIHTNNSVIDFGYKLSKQYNIPHVWHLREFADLDFNYQPFRLDYIKDMNKSYNVAISKVILNHWVKKGISKDKISIVCDGIDMDTIESKTNYKVPKKIKMVFVGSLCEAKGQYDFIKSISKIKSDVLNNLELHLIGTGEKKYQDLIESLIREKKLEKVVFIDGYNPNIRKDLKNYDVGIINSRSEAFGRVTVEYMATGLCVLASNTGANLEIIEDKKTGIIFKYQDAKDICKQIEYLYDNKDLINSIGVNAKKDVNKKYSKEENAKNVYDLYKKILGDKNDL